MSEDNAAMDWNDNIGIVNKLLENRKFLPTLIGIHPTLDKRIGIELKKDGDTGLLIQSGRKESNGIN